MGASEDQIMVGKMNKELITRIRVLFKQKLAAKTGWGKNEVLTTYDEAVTEACLEVIDGQDNEAPTFSKGKADAGMLRASPNARRPA